MFMKCCQSWKKLYYPKGILSQSAEAGKKLLVLMQPLGLQQKEEIPCTLNISKNRVDYQPQDIYPYAPPAGKQALREAWKE